jgi:hypothetical protein
MKIKMLIIRLNYKIIQIVMNKEINIWIIKINNNNNKWIDNKIKELKWRNK